MLPYQSDWWGLLKSSTALITMSEAEGSPNVLLEAVAGRCPVIVSNIDEHKEILGEQSEYYVDLFDSKALSIAILKVLQNLNTSSVKTNNAFTSTNKYEISTIAREYSTLYNSILLK